MRAVARELAVEPVARLERDDVAGLDVRDGLEVRDASGCAPRRTGSSQELPDPVGSVAWPPRSPPRVHARGAPSWCTERIASSRPSRSTGVTICAARPPYASSIAWNAGSSYAARQSSCTTWRPSASSSTTGCRGDRPSARRGASRRPARAPPRRRERRRRRAGRGAGSPCSPRSRRASPASTSCSSATGRLSAPGQGYARPMALDGLRKVVTIVEDVVREGGEPVEPATRMVAAGAVVENPFAGRFVADLEPLIDRYCEPLGELLTTAGARSSRRARRGRRQGRARRPRRRRRARVGRDPQPPLREQGA